MTETELIAAMRLRVFDTSEPPFLADAAYQSAIRAAVAWLNARLKTSYSYTPGGEPSGLELLLSPYDYFIELKASANIAMQRAAGTAANGTQRRERVEVPNLQVEKEFYDNNTSIWSDLADDLLRELDDLLKDAVESEAVVQSHYVFIRDPQTGARSHRNLDTALPAVPITATWNAGKARVDLAWAVVASMYFAENRVERSPAADFSESLVVLRRSYDPHEVSGSDTPGPGTWFYRLVTTSTNVLETLSPVAAVVVP